MKLLFQKQTKSACCRSKCFALSTVFVFVFLLCSISRSQFIQAGVFGDAIEGNGYEDDRLTRDQAAYWPKEFRAVGRLICEERVQGSAILINFDEQAALAAGANTGIGIENVSEVRRPVLLTAKHVVTGFNLENCYFSSESYGRNRVPILSVRSSGSSGVDKKDALNDQESNNIILRYEEDWALLNLEPWSNWQENALRLNNNKEWPHAIEGHERFVAYMVGYDLINHQIVADYHCHAGPALQTSLLVGKDLIWDSCDSEQGSSGGALFVESEGELLLVGMRVGSLFDLSRFDGEPKVGEKFDLDSYINVSRTLPF